MPTGYHIDTSLRTIFRSFHGTLTHRDLIEDRKAIFADPAFDPTFQHLADVRPVVDIELSSNDIHHLASLPFLPKTSRKAYVVANDLQYGLLRMYQVLCGEDERTFRVFRSMEEAWDWLGLPRDRLLKSDHPS
jgi:hypothetical protein